MPSPIKAPGVFIVEKNAFPNSVVEVATAVPAFIGYTEQADSDGHSLLNVPWRISSLAEFHTYFGAAPPMSFTVSAGATPASFQLKQDPASRYILYYSLLLFFQNGGGLCYIVAVGNYSQRPEPTALTSGIELLLKEQEPTMLVIPEAVLLSEQDCLSVQKAMLKHCGLDTKSRMAILDIHEGYRERNDPAGDPVAAFRSGIGTDQLDFGAAYYPWLRANVEGPAPGVHAPGVRSISNPDDLKDVLKKAVDPAGPGAQKDLLTIDKIFALIATGNDKPELTMALTQLSPVFVRIVEEMHSQLNLLPPSGAMAGVWTRVDGAQGVWNAPANIGLIAVIGPAVSITSAGDDLNVSTDGKSVNAIRSFVGQGTLVWGARTLDGNSAEWRYLSIRRTAILLEQSLRLAIGGYAFANNEATTWMTIKAMIDNFLTGLWKRGALQGVKPEEAFQVRCGLGETMTADDVSNGRLRVTVLAALVRPAEFMVFTFEQQMAQS